MEVTRPNLNILRLPPPVQDGRPYGRADDKTSESPRIEVLVEEGENFSASTNRSLAERDAHKSETAEIKKFRERLHSATQQPAERPFRAGYPSAPFLAQQIAQMQESETMQDTAAPEHREASQAYSDTLGLTAFVELHSGIRQKVA